MKIIIRHLLILPLLILIVSCKENNESGTQQLQKTISISDTSLVVVATDIITEVVVKQKPGGDPWELEKVQGYNGNIMIDKIFDDIYETRLKVYEYHSGLELTANDVKLIEKDFNSDRSLIGKIQFTEDWYFDPQTDAIVKDIKSIVFGVELKEESGNVYGYKALFQVKYK